MTSKEAWEVLKELPPSWSADHHPLTKTEAGILYAKGYIRIIQLSPIRCKRSPLGDDVVANPLAYPWEDPIDEVIVLTLDDVQPVYDTYGKVRR